MTQPAIRIDTLTKSFGRGKNQFNAVDHLSFEVQPGQVYGFLGPNGAGKSTTIRMLLDLIHPTAGTAYIYGQPVQSGSATLEKRVGSLVEGAMFYNFMTGHQNLETLARTNNSYDKARVDALLELVGMADRADRRVGGYSTGMKQRLGIASTMLHNPDLVILDEPTNGLDPKGIQEMRVIIRNMVDKYGKTVFLSSHILSEIEQICDRVAIINRGRLVQEGGVAELLEDQVAIRVEAKPVRHAAQILGQHWKVVPNGIWITVDARHEDSPNIVRVLTDHDIEVFQVMTQRRTLEEYFLEVTEGAPKTITQEVEAVNA